jgi:hypothetical protein
MFFTCCSPRSTNDTGSFVPIWSRTVPETQIPPASARASKPGRDIDGIAEEVFPLHHNVAEVDADTEPHLLTGRSIRILLGYGILHHDSTLHGVHGTGEIGDETVASRVEDPTAMRGDQGIDDGSVSVESAEGADLIEPHEAAVAFDIRGEDGDELPADGHRV